MIYLVQKTLDSLLENKYHDKFLQLNEIYFQISIEYTKEFNEKIIRIITDKTKISTKKEEIEKNATLFIKYN